jgi:hypothetical protein
MIDQRMIAVLQAMAESKNCYNDNNGRMGCIYCECEGQSAQEWDIVFHDDNCPVVVARIMLKEIEIAIHVMLRQMEERKA